MISLVRFGGLFFICYHVRMKKHEEELYVEPDLAYWLEHVVHWHALLVALILVVSLAYVFAGGSFAWAR